MQLLNIVKFILSISSNWVMTFINANAAPTLLEQRLEKNIQALSGIRTHDPCDAGAVLSQMSYQSHIREFVYANMFSAYCIHNKRLNAGEPHNVEQNNLATLLPDLL